MHPHACEREHHPWQGMPLWPAADAPWSELGAEEAVGL